MKPNPIALVIDAERQTRRLLRVLLESNHYRIQEAETGETGMREAAARRPDVIILDLSLPDMEGRVFLERLREWNCAPVLILSERDNERDKVMALDGGANDYMTKPFGPAELLSRLRVLLRPMPSEPDGPLLINGDLQVNLASHLVTMRGRRVDLTPTEEALFYTLARHAGKVVTQRHLLRCVWGADSENRLHDLHVYIRSLRRKLGGAGDEILIRTEGSVGYRLLLPAGGEALPAPPSPPKLAVASGGPGALTEF